MHKLRKSQSHTKNLGLAFDLGIEDEAWAFKDVGREVLPVDVSAFVTEFAARKSRYGNVFRESGFGSIEFAGTNASSVADAAYNVRMLHDAAVRAGLQINFTNERPYTQVFETDTLETGKSRFKAIVAAAQEESPVEWMHLLRQNLYAALHLHLSFKDFPVRSDFVAPQMIFVDNVLNLIGPRVAKIICCKYGLSNTGHLGIFSRWADPRRFSRYGQWYADFNDLRFQLGQLRRFIHCVSGDKENGNWEKDLKTPMSWGDHDVAELGLWPISRLRTKQGTIEIRILPSVPLEILDDVARDIVDLVVYLLSIAPSHSCRVDDIGDFMTSVLWDEIKKFKIADHATMPSEYTKAMWMNDVFN